MGGDCSSSSSSSADDGDELPAASSMKTSVECLLEEGEVVVSSSKSEEADDEDEDEDDDHKDNEDDNHKEEEEDDSTAEETAAELSWRLSPQESMSDWTLKIRRTKSGRIDTYYVHKSILAVGPKRSNYFVKTFQNNNKNNNKNAAATEAPRSPLTLLVPAGDDASMCSSGSVGGHPMMMECGKYLNESLEKAEILLDPTMPDSSSSMIGPRQQQLQPSTTTATVIELDDLAADAVPAVLDFCYCSSNVTTLEISTSNATALHVLGRKFGMKLLRKTARDFWTQDLNMDNFLTYYSHARILGDDKVLARAQEYCAAHIFDVREASVVDILGAVDPVFFWNVITTTSSSSSQGIVTPAAEAEAAPQDRSSLRLSLLVAVFCNIHQDELTPQMFARLTDASLLPDIEVKAAKVLVEMEDNICNNRHKLTSLKERCIDVLAQHWDEGCFGQDAAMTVTLPRLSGPALDHFVTASFINAKKRLDELQEIRRERDELKKELSALRNGQEVEQIQAFSMEEKKGEEFEEIKKGEEFSLSRPAVKQLQMKIEASIEEEKKGQE